MAKGERHAGWSGFFMVFTAFAAVFLTLSRQGQELVPTGSAAWQTLSVYEGAACWAVPALFMLWGMAALEEGDRGVAGALTGLALPCLCLLVFWGAVYAAAAHLLGGGEPTLKGVLDALWLAARGNTYFHLWILYPLLGLYLVHPVLRRFVSGADRGEVLYLLVLCFLFAGLLPLGEAFWPDHAAVRLLARLQVHLALGFTGCYVGGWYLYAYTINRLSEFILYLLGVLGLALTVLGNRFLGGGRELWYSPTAPGVLLTAAALCTLFRYVLGISDERSRRRAVYRLGFCAFGAYLFHQLWMLVLSRLGLSLAALNPVLSVPLFALALFLLSLPFSWALSAIPGAGKWLV